MTTFVTSTIIKAVDKASGPFRKIDKQAQTLRRSLRGVTAASRQLTQAGQTMTRGITAPMTLLAGNSLRMATAFEASMNNVNSKLLDMTDTQRAQLESLAKELGIVTQFSASEAADAMGFLAQAGLDVNEILGATPRALELAAAGNISLAEAADIATNVMGGFRMEFDEAGNNFQRVADVMAATSASTNTSITEMAEGFRDAAPIAASFGLSIEETAAVMGQLANMGIKGSDAGTAFRNIVTTLVNPTGEAAAVIERLGVRQSELFTVNERGERVFKSFADIMQTLNERGATGADIMALFGRRAGPKMLALMGGSVEEIERLTNAIQNSGGAAERMAQIQMSGLPGLFKSLASAWEGFNIALTESGAFDPIIAAVQKLTLWLRELANTNPTLLKIAGTLGLIVAALGPIVLFLGLFGHAIVGIVTGLPLLIAGFALLKTGIVIATGAVWGFTVALLANPLTWIVLAIVAVVGALVWLAKNWDRVRAAFQNNTWMKVVFAPIFVTIELLHLAFSLLKAAWLKVSEFFRSINPFEWLASKVEGLIDLINKIPGIEIEGGSGSGGPGAAAGAQLEQETLAAYRAERARRQAELGREGVGVGGDLNLRIQVDQDGQVRAVGTDASRTTGVADVGTTMAGAGVL